MPASEVAVAGLGAMGSAALYHLTKRGVHVIGFEMSPIGVLERERPR